MPSNNQTVLLHTLLRTLPLAIIAVLLAGFVLYRVSLNQLQLNAIETLQDKARQDVAHLQRRLANKQDLVHFLATNPSIAKSLLGVIDANIYLTPLLQSINLEGNLGTLAISNAQGEFLATTPTIPAHLPSAATMARIVAKGQPISKFDQQTLYLIMPIRHHGQPIGAVLLMYQRAELLQLLQLGNLSGEMAILDANDQPILYRHADLAQVYAILNGDPHWLHMINPLPLGEVGSYKLLSVISRSDLAVYLQKQRWIIITAAVLNLFIVIISVFYTANAVRTPLRRLSSGIQHIRNSGDLSHRINTNGPKELTQIENAFNQLTSELEASIYRSKHDALTQLANRGEFDQVLEQEWRRAIRMQKPLTLLLMDVDHFKAYNDFYGHPQGDQCLKAVAKVISESCLRSMDGCFRYGGEEFAVLLPETKSGAAVAYKLLQAMAAAKVPHERSSCSQWVSMSIGCATLIPSIEDSSTQLLDLADQALYQAKEAGRNTFKIAEIPASFITPDEASE
ncbi:MAG: diguanylate cyclase [Ferrimonas sp.]